MYQGIYKLNNSKETDDEASSKLLSLNNTYIVIRDEVEYSILIWFDLICTIHLLTLSTLIITKCHALKRVKKLFTHYFIVRLNYILVCTFNQLEGLSDTQVLLCLLQIYRLHSNGKKNLPRKSKLSTFYEKYQVYIFLFQWKRIQSTILKEI